MICTVHSLLFRYVSLFLRSTYLYYYYYHYFFASHVAIALFWRSLFIPIFDLDVCVQKRAKKREEEKKKNKKYWKIPTEREYNTFRIQLYMEWWINLFRTSFFDSPWHSNYHSAKLNVGFQSPVKSRWGTYTHTFHIWFVYVKSMTYKGRQINEIFLWLDNFPANLATLVFTYCILYNWSSLVNIVHWWRWTLWDEAENLIYVMPRGVRTASCIHL